MVIGGWWKGFRGQRRKDKFSVIIPFWSIKPAGDILSAWMGGEIHRQEREFVASREKENPIIGSAKRRMLLA